MRQSFSKKLFLTTIIFMVFVGVIIYGCGKTTSPIITAPTTCVNSHKTIYDSICNMNGTRPSYEHKVYFEYDSGRLVKHTVHDTTGINFTISVASDKTVSYQNYTYALIDSNGTVMHFAFHNINANHTDIFYYPSKDSFVVASYVTTSLPQVTQTTLDTLFTYW